MLLFSCVIRNTIECAFHEYSIVANRIVDASAVEASNLVFRSGLCYNRKEGGGRICRKENDGKKTEIVIYWKQPYLLQ